MSLKKILPSDLKKFQLVKTLHVSLAHNGFAFKEGLNDIAPDKFSMERPCSPGGIYFVQQRDFARWVCYTMRLNALIADVSLPDDAQVCAETDEDAIVKYKADKVVLSNIRALKGFVEAHYQWAMEALSHEVGDLLFGDSAKQISLHPLWFNDLPKDFITDEMTWAVVKHHPMVFKFAQNQTEEMCICLIKRSLHYIELVKDLTPRIVKTAFTIALQQEDRLRELLYGDARLQSPEWLLMLIEMVDGDSSYFVKDLMFGLCAQNATVFAAFNKKFHLI